MWLSIGIVALGYAFAGQLIKNQSNGKETSQLISDANHLTGFHMVVTFVVNDLILKNGFLKTYYGKIIFTNCN